MHPYLILHKVRGEPAFDIAHRIDIDGESAWIVSTSGHRAYPYATWAVAELYLCNGPHSDQPKLLQSAPWPEMPEGWPDHYQPNASNSKDDKSAEICEMLGVNRAGMAIKFTDRRF